jgi:hypothetical protein
MARATEDLAPRRTRPEFAELALAAVDLAGALAKRRTKTIAGTPTAASAKAARRLNRAAGLLAASVLTDSAVKHQRGAFEKALYAPLAASTLSLAASLHGVNDKSPRSHTIRDVIYGLAATTAVVGGGFHLYNVTKCPGVLSRLNLFCGASLGAQFALLLSGLLGFTAERVRENPPGAKPHIFGLPAGRAMAVLSSIGMLGTVGEAASLRVPGAYHDPATFLPATVPPVAAGLLANAAMASHAKHRRFAQGWLRMAVGVGFAGVSYRIFGSARNRGGRRNGLQTVMNGLPVLPTTFTGLALAGLVALGLLDEHPDD